SPSAPATACAKRPSWNPCWMSPTRARSLASRSRRSRRPPSAASSARASGESSIPRSRSRRSSCSRRRWKSGSSRPRAPRVDAVARGELVEDVLVALEARGLELRPLQLDVLLELLLRLADVAFVLEDDREGLGDERLVERLHVEERQGLRPVERLADARGLFEIELADAVDDGHDLGGQPLRHARDLQLHDLELLRPIGEVDEEVQAAALESVGHLARV